MNNAQQLKQLADQHHYGTLEVDTLFAITEKIGRLATIEANKGSYEASFACGEGIGFNAYLPATTVGINIVRQELHKKGFSTKLYSRADTQEYIIVVSWAEASPKQSPSHPAIMNVFAPF